MDIDKYNREQAELERKKREEAKAAYKLKPGEYICPRCKDYIIDSERRFHPCSREGVTVPAVYFPNVGKPTKNSDPAYRKHAGSRPERFRRSAVYVTPTFDLSKTTVKEMVATALKRFERYPTADTL